MLLSALAGLGLIGMLLAGYTQLLARKAAASFPPAGQFVEVEGRRLHYVARGRGRHVVFLHGDGGSVLDWTMSPVFDAAAANYQAIAFDRPGLGYSERPNDGWSAFVQARLIRAALLKLGIHRPLLVGHSRGGQVVLAYAIAYPDEVTGVVAVAPGAFYERLGYPIAQVLASRPIVDIVAYTILVPVGFPFARASLDIAFAPDPAPQEYLQAYAGMLLRPSQLRAWARDIAFGYVASQEIDRRYGEIRAPLIIVQGDADRNVSLRSSQRIHDAAPRSQLAVVSGKGHELMFVAPQAVMGAIRQVLDGLE